jgi:hypothetical protein
MPQKQLAQEECNIVWKVKRRRLYARKNRRPKELMKIEQGKFTGKDGANIMDIIGKVLMYVIVMQEEERVFHLNYSHYTNCQQ